MSAADLAVPKNSEWGPVLWEILHGIAEKAGNTPHQFILDDQQREIIYVLRMLEAVMPCALCRKHYQEWKRLHPLEGLGSGPGFFPAVREWLFSLHAAVNKSREVDVVFTHEMLHERYGNYVLKPKMLILEGLLKRAVRGGAVEFEAVKSFSRHLFTLIRLVL
jgi:hypothetical protein